MSAVSDHDVPLNRTRVDRGIVGRGRTVALVGPDGAGKSTIAARAAELLPRSRVIYLGVNLDDDPLALPTTRLRARLRRGSSSDDHVRQVRGDGRAGSSERSSYRRFGSLPYWLNMVAEEWYRLALVAYLRRRGWIVLLDRHVLADYFPWTGGGSWGRSLHDLLLRRLCPRPDLVVLLDAPPKVYFSRKGELTVEELERRRRAYRELGRLMPRFVVVDATGPIDGVVGEVVGHIDALVAVDGSAHPPTGA